MILKKCKTILLFNRCGKSSVVIQWSIKRSKGKECKYRLTSNKTIDRSCMRDRLLCIINNNREYYDLLSHWCISIKFISPLRIVSCILFGIFASYLWLIWDHQATALLPSWNLQLPHHITSMLYSQNRVWNKQKHYLVAF